MRRATAKGQGGFTMVEAIIVIVIIGIIGGIVGLFIRGPVLNYHDSVLRADLTDTADLALRRMARDLRLALPNSIRVSADGRAIEFLETKTGGRYLSAEDDAAAPLLPLDFNDTSKTSFTMIGAAPSGKETILANSDYIVVNNLGFAPVDAYQANAAGVLRNIAQVTGVTTVGGYPMIALASNPFAAQTPPMPSPSARFQVVSGPVTYYCNPGATGTGSLSRQWNYPIGAAQLSPPVPVGTPVSRAAPQSNYIAKHVTSCAFDYSVANNTRSAVVRLSLLLEYPDQDSNAHVGVQLVHQVHVDNTP